MTTADTVAGVLGGAKVFKGAARPSAAEIRDRIKTGLPYQSLQSVREQLQLSMPETAALLGVPLRTLARRRHGKLQADESDRLYRLARVAVQAVMVLGDWRKAGEWLRRPNRALNGESPLRLLDTDVGARQIETILGRIESGVIG